MRDKNQKIIEKQEIRRFLRTQRKKLSSPQRQKAEKKVSSFLNRWIRRNQRIAVYYSVGSELNLNDFIQTAQQRGAKIYLPFLEKNKQRMWFTLLPKLSKLPKMRPNARQKPRFTKKSLDIPQFYGKKIRAHHIQTMILPLVGADKRGYRLGQGGGYYDVSLVACRHRLQPKKIGVGFACQLCDEVPAEAHDAKLDFFVCEQGVLKF